MLGKLALLLVTMRPKQWTKNSFVFAGLVFSLSTFQIEPFFKVLQAFLVFCALSGGVYVINDVTDSTMNEQSTAAAKQWIKNCED